MVFFAESIDSGMLDTIVSHIVACLAAMSASSLHNCAQFFLPLTWDLIHVNLTMLVVPSEVRA